jgi:hypothetical protein
MTDQKAFYTSKFNNFKVFVKVQSKSSLVIASMFRKYLAILFNVFMFGIVHKIVVSMSKKAI